MSIHELEKRYGIKDSYMLFSALFLLALSLAIFIRPFFDIYNLVRLYQSYGLSLSIPVFLLFCVSMIISLTILVVKYFLSIRQQLVDTIVRTKQSPSEKASIYLTFQKLIKDIEHLKTEQKLLKHINFRYDPMSDDISGKVRKYEKRPLIIISRGLVKHYSKEPRQALAIISHELSHVELDDIRFTNVIRWMLRLYLYVFTLSSLALFLIYLIGVDKFLEGGYLTEQVVGGPFRILAPYGVVASVLLASYMYAHYYLVRREHLHDYRAIEILKNSQPLIEIFQNRKLNKANNSWRDRTLQYLKYFIRFHPTPSSRLNYILNKDPLRVDTLVYPAITGIVLAHLAPVIYVFIDSYFSASESFINLFNTGILAIITFVILRSDVSRFSVRFLEGKIPVLQILKYAFVVSTSSILSIFFVVILLGITRLDLSLEINSIAHILSGGLASFIYYSVLLFFLSSWQSRRINNTLNEPTAKNNEALFFVIGSAITIFLSVIHLLLRHALLP